MAHSFTYFADEYFAGLDTEVLELGESPSVTALDNGGFVAVWTSEGTFSGIRAQIFDADGQAIGTSFEVYGSPGYYPSVAALSSGGFVVSWEHSDASLAGVSARIYDASGNPLGDEFPLSTNVDSQQQPVVTGLLTGGFVACWTSQDYGIEAQIFDAAGAKVGDAFAITLSASYQYYPQVATLESGGFVVTWNEGYSINAQFFNANGARVGDQIVVSDVPNNMQYYGGITVLESGNVVVTWTEDQFDDPDRIKAQILSASGEKIGTPITVNSGTADAGMATVTALDSGGFVVTWRVDTNGSPNFADRGDINAQLFDANGLKIGDQFLVNVDTQLGQSEPQVASFGSGDFSITWLDFNGSSQSSLESRLFFSADTLTESDDNYDGTTGRDFVRGLDGSDSLNGLAGNDHLDGGLGADSMTGGEGDDSYVVDDIDDTVIELADEGYDHIESNLGVGATLAERIANIYRLAANVELLAGTGINQGLRGNSLSNVITAGAGADYFDMSDGASDYVMSGDGRDVIYYGAALDAGDINYAGDAGGDPRGDLLVIQGDYEITLGPSNLGNVEKLRVLKAENTSFGYEGGGTFDYSITTVDDNVDWGARLVVQGGSLQIGEHLTFDGSAETDGTFQIFGGRDSDELIGGEGNDHLLGRAGADILTGNGGADRLRGGLGGDAMDGGTGADIFVYAAQGGDQPYAVAALESTSLNYDTISGFNYAEDKIDLPQTVASLAQVLSGSLSDASFDADLALAVDVALAANGAVLFNVTAGDHSGQTFLIIDGDNNGGYQADLDYVIQLQSPTGTVPTGTENFI